MMYKLVFKLEPEQLLANTFHKLGETPLNKKYLKHWLCAMALSNI